MDEASVCVDILGIDLHAQIFGISITDDRLSSC